MGDRRWVALGWLMIGVGGALILSSWPPAPLGGERESILKPMASAAVFASPTPEPLVPTRTSVGYPDLASTSPTPLPFGQRAADPASVMLEGEAPSWIQTPVASPTPTPRPSRVPSVSATPRSMASTRTPVGIPGIAGPRPTSGAPVSSSALQYQGRFRWGVGVPIGPITRYPVESLQIGWYLDWRAQVNPPRPGGMEYVPMVRIRGGRLDPDPEALAQRVRAQPGALWLIGNEPDVKWQDNVEPDLYAQLYHQAYWAIKGTDPSARVAIGGVAQPTPLRLRYLDQVLRAYRKQFGVEMPVDIWNVHNFILREERGSWGVDIPPGLPDRWGRLYTVDDSGNLGYFRQQIWEFRRWMAERGFRGRPLIVSEYGIPMPEDYGFPPERVIAFLRGTFEFFLTAADPVLGDPSDGYRLVQRWCWYSLDDTTYPTGRLFDPQTGALTAVGEGWVSVVSQWIGGER